MNRLILAVVTAICLSGIVVAAPIYAQNAPFAGGAKGADKDPAVDKLVAAANKMDAQLKAKPKDTKLKEKTAEAYYQAGFACEYSKVLSPKPKYRGALKQYRRCLELNPKHAKAAAEKKQIEDIYKQMGMPVPQ